MRHLIDADSEAQVSHSNDYLISFAGAPWVVAESVFWQDSALIDSQPKEQMPDRQETIDRAAMSLREAAAMMVHSHAMRRGMTWRHALRDVLAASDAAAAGRSWVCPTCGASYHPDPDESP